MTTSYLDYDGLETLVGEIKDYCATACTDALADATVSATDYMGAAWTLTGCVLASPDYDGSTISFGSDALIYGTRYGASRFVAGGGTFSVYLWKFTGLYADALYRVSGDFAVGGDGLTLIVQVGDGEAGAGGETVAEIPCPTGGQTVIPPTVFAAEEGSYLAFYLDGADDYERVDGHLLLELVGDYDAAASKLQASDGTSGNAGGGTDGE